MSEGSIPKINLSTRQSSDANVLMLDGVLGSTEGLMHTGLYFTIGARRRPSCSRVAEKGPAPQVSLAVPGGPLDIITLFSEGLPTGGDQGPLPEQLNRRSHEVQAACIGAVVPVIGPLILLAAGCDATGPGADLTLRQSNLAMPAPASLYSFVFPLGVRRDQVVVAGSSRVDLDDRVHTLNPVASTGGMTIGADATINGDVTVLGRKGAQVTIRDRAQVFGRVSGGAQVVLGNNTHITGGIGGKPATGGPIDVISVSVTKPSGTCVDGQVLPDRTATFGPGHLCRLHVYSRSRLVLTSGTYFVDNEFALEPQATLELNVAAGPIVVYVSGQITHRGTITIDGNHPDRFLLANLGNQIVNIEAPMNGTVFSPYVGIEVETVLTQTPHTGQFLGQYVRVHQDNLLKFVPFRWETVTDQEVVLGLVGPFSTLQGAVNSGLAKDARIYSDTGDEGGEIFFHTSEGYFYTDPVVGTHFTDSQGEHYQVTPNTSEIPTGATVDGQGHSHPEGGQPGADDFNPKFTIWFIDSEGDRFIIPPGSKEPVNIGKLSDDPEDGVLPPTENPNDESIDEGQFIDGVSDPTGVELVDLSTIVDVASGTDTSGDNGFFGGFFDDFFSGLGF